MKINHPRRYLLLAAAIAGLATIVHFGDDGVEIYIPRTLVHYKCRFPDGSYTEYKERYKWYFYLEALPVIVNTRGNLDSMKKYVDVSGKTYEDRVATTGPGTRNCSGIGKRDGRFFSEGGFEDAKGQWVVSPRFDSTERWGRRENLPKKLSHHVPKSPTHPYGVEAPPTEDQKFLEEEHLSPGYGTYVLPFGDENTFLFEQPLIIANNPFSPEYAQPARKPPSAPFSTVLYVYQSLSSDNGKTWSPPVITKDAKLFEIGKLVTEQSWSAKPDVIVKNP